MTASVSATACASASSPAPAIPSPPAAPDTPPSWVSLESSLIAYEARLARRLLRALAHDENHDTDAADARALGADAATLCRLITARRAFQKGKREQEIDDRQRMEDQDSDQEGEGFDDEAFRFQEDETETACD